MTIVCSFPSSSSLFFFIDTFENICTNKLGVLRNDITIEIPQVYATSSGIYQASTCTNSRAFASGSRVKIAGLPDLLSV